VSRRRPPRLSPGLYRGQQRYFLTICCHQRRRLLTVATVQSLVVSQLRRTSNSYGFAVFVYCLMPDHLHVVAEGLDDDSDFLAFVKAFKQQTSFAWKRSAGTPLWQESFYDHVLRDAERTQHVVRYVLENPVRAGIVCAPEAYEHSGSFVYGRRELIEWAFGWNRGT
jgi:putative transposase